MRWANAIAPLDIIGGPQVTHLETATEAQFRERHRGKFAVPLAASALFILHCLIALALIPPWQQPDEPTYVTSIEAHVSRLTSSRATDRGREAEILQSMARYDWWRHRRPGGQPPAVIADNFLYAAAGGPVQVGSSAPGEADTPTYALVTGRMLSWLPRMTVVDDLYFLRVFSAVAGLLTLWVAWLGARECLGALGGATVAMVMALHPQFAIMSTAASPDSLVNLAGACVWWQASIAVRRKQMWPVATMWAAAIFATSVDRMGVPLLIVALCVSGVVGIARAKGLRWRPALLSAAIAMSGLGAAAWALRRFGTLFDFTLDPSTTVAVTWTSFLSFNWVMHQTWWFSPGWGLYAPPAWWTVIVAILTVLAVAGALHRPWKAGVDPQTHGLLALAAAGIAIYLTAVYGGTYFRLGVSAQGRYVFPVLVPSLVILWAGLETWVPRSRHAQAAAALIVLLAVLDAAAWSLVVLPAYYASF